MDIETVVYYSIQRAPGSFADTVIPSPIHSAIEKEMALQEAKQEVHVTLGDLKIVVLVCDDLTDVEIHQQVNFLKTAALGLRGDFARSRYWEDADGIGFEDEFDGGEG